jgi:hypothetical protein
LFFCVFLCFFVFFLAGWSANANDAFSNHNAFEKLEKNLRTENSVALPMTEPPCFVASGSASCCGNTFYIATLPESTSAAALTAGVLIAASVCGGCSPTVTLTTTGAECSIIP